MSRSARRRCEQHAFHQHDGAIDEDAEVDGAHRNQIGGQPDQLQPDEGGEQRERDDRRHDQRTAKAAQKEPDHGDHQQRTKQKVVVDCRERFADQPRPVVERLDVHPLREDCVVQLLHLCMNAVQDRGGNITRQYLYQLEHGKKTASLNKLTMILDACGVTMSDFLGTDLVIGPRGDTNILERKFVTMLTTIRKLNPSLARVVGGAIISAHAEAIKLSKQQESKGVGPEGRNRQTQRRTYQSGPGTAKGQTSN